MSAFARLAPFHDYSALYNSMNFDLPPCAPANTTTASFSPGGFICPGDPQARQAEYVISKSAYADRGGWSQAYTSYGGNMGTWNLEVHPSDANYTARHSAMNGVIFGESAIGPREVPDGFANTLLFGEHRHDALPTIDPGRGRSQYHWWTSGHCYDTFITTFYPINAPKTLNLGWNDRAMNLGSGHQGGANVACADASVRFLKETIDSWPITPSTGTPAGVSYDPVRRVYSVVSGKSFGVLQKLSTRACGDLIPLDSY